MTKSGLIMTTAKTAKPTTAKPEEVSVAKSFLNQFKSFNETQDIIKKDYQYYNSLFIKKIDDEITLVNTDSPSTELLKLVNGNTLEIRFMNGKMPLLLNGKDKILSILCPENTTEKDFKLEILQKFKDQFEIDTFKDAIEGLIESYRKNGIKRKQKSSSKMDDDIEF